MTPYTIQPERFAAPSSAAADAPALECDVLIVGGGPAGSTAAALLAERGVDVLMLEKNAHPRFHIGESLLPRNLEIFDRLGIRDQVAALGVHKGGGEFVSDDEGGKRVAFNFAQGLSKVWTYAFQVPRGPFDELLFKTAAARGARTMERIRVADIAFGAAGERARVTAVDAEGETHVFAPRYVLDASGRDTFLASRLGTKNPNKANNTAAAYAHYRGVAPREGEMAGYVSIHLAEDGWFWMIPLPDGVMSVGFVGTQAAFKRRRGTMEQFLEERIRLSPTTRERMAGAERVSEVTGTGNYSYRASAASGAGYMMIGDAFAFLDPVFSSGVFLAMTAGQFGADVAALWLKDPKAAAALARASEKRLCRGMDTLGWLIYRINDPVMREMFMNPQNRFKMRDGLVALLAGNLELDHRSRMPVLAFKAIFYMLSAGKWLRGLRQATALAPSPSVAAE